MFGFIISVLYVNDLVFLGIIILLHLIWSSQVLALVVPPEEQSKQLARKRVSVSVHLTSQIIGNLQINMQHLLE